MKIPEASNGRVFVMLLVALGVSELAIVGAWSTCHFPAIYNFGDSNSDTGGIYAAFYQPQPPYGETYFHHTAGRASDGRLIIDFIAEHLGLPYLSSYLDTVGTSFRHGANFATGGATIRRQNIESWFLNGVSPFPLEIQTAQFDQFKSRSSYFYKHGGEKGGRKSSYKRRLPRPEDFSRALYVFDIGQNDLAAGFRNLSYQALERLNETIPDMVDQLAQAVQHLYEQGGRTFWIHNAGPIGCLPLTLRWVKDPIPGYLDKQGCIRDQNEMASEFNRQLNEKVKQLRQNLPDAALTYVDVYSAKYELIGSAKEQGFKNPKKMCCGVEWKDKHVSCGSTADFNGTKLYAGSCKDPSSSISWDGVHYTEATNRWLACRIISGSFSDHQAPLSYSCHKFQTSARN